MTKRRLFLSILLTILFVFLANNFWLTSKPVNVRFKVFGNGEYHFTVNYNDKIQTVQKNISESEDVSFYIRSLKKPYKLELSIFPPSIQKISISPVIVECKTKDTLSGIKNFKFINVKQSSLEDNKLIIEPENIPTTLIYKNKINIKNSIKFDLKVFIIILILSFLLSYKITNYLADFKSTENKSRIDIVFVTIFFILLFTPMSHINRNDINENENRALNKFMPLFINGNFNYLFGSQFNEWFNDRFYLRAPLTNLAYKINNKINPTFENPMVLAGKDKWLFIKYDRSIFNYQNADLFKENELKLIADYLNNVNDYCKKHNQKFYFFIAPDKNKIYGEYYPSSILKVRSDEKSRAMQLINYLNKNTDIKVIYPYHELNARKNSDILYFKTDTHWTPLGSYYGYKTLMDSIKKDFPSIKPVKMNGHKIIYGCYGDLIRVLPQIIQKYYNDDDIAYKVPLYSKEHNNYSQIIYGDSFSTDLKTYLDATLKQSIRYEKKDIHAKEIKNTDIVILETVERYLPQLLNNHFEGE